jgi:phosphocarrier protein FPr
MKLLKRLFKKTTPIKTRLSITSPNGFHLRPIAKFANEAKKFDATITLHAKGKSVVATQVPNILSLSLERGEEFTLSCLGKDADMASKHLSDFFVNLMQTEKPIEKIAQEDQNYQSPILKGESIARGIAIAPLVTYEMQEHTEESRLSINQAIQQSIKELEDLHQSLQISPQQREILEAQQSLLLADSFQQNFKDISAFKHHIQREIDQLKGGKFASRIADYQDIERRVLAHVGVISTIKLPTTPYILVADELLPSEVTELNSSPIQGVILQKGTITSHTAILLRASSIPSMIIHQPISQSSQAILDANSGNLITHPSQEDIQQATTQQQKEKTSQEQNYQRRFEPTHTKQGRKINVLANITDLNSAKEAKELGAEGIGLLRTEFLFANKRPTLEEQRQTYQEIFALFDEITIRTLDIGGDKSLPYVDIPHEANPFLGLRGIRFSLQERELFQEQLLAIFLAHQGKAIKIMFPMISDKQEFRDAKAIALEVAQKHQIDISNIQFGIMIEVPSVILAIKLFDKGVDFYSIGTNDLTQYLFAIERTHPTLKVDATHPILMSALKIIIDTTHKPISICGELAALPQATQALIQMGYSTLSVSPKLIPSLKERIRHV